MQINVCGKCNKVLDYEKNIKINVVYKECDCCKKEKIKTYS